jgi:hypothetical protein
MKVLNKQNLERFIILVFFTFWICYFVLFWSKALFFDTLGNLVAGHVNIWGDWAAHMTMGTAMGVRGPLLKTSPLIVNHSFAYPFVSNMISGLLLKTGLPTIISFVLPSFLFSVATVFSLFWLYKTLFRSRMVALLASLIFLLNGGVGFYYFAQDVATSPNPVQTLLNPPHEYTRYDKKQLKWISVIDSMIIPQRAFALGFPLAIIALGLIYKASYSKKNEQRVAQTVTAGTLIGFLPIIHTHSFLALFIILAGWSGGDILAHLKKENLVTRIIHWASLALITAIFALPLISMFLAGNVSQGFMSWFPGWLAKEFDVNWFVFWFKNWTVVPLLALVSWWLFHKKAAKNLPPSYLFAPFFCIFVIANLWLFQPFAWDNTKLFVWSSVGFSGLIAWLLSYGWKHAKKLVVVKKKVLKVLIVATFILITASGAIDAYYIVRHDLHSHIMFSREEVLLAQWAKESTDPESIWLTGDQHNHWLFVLTGRQALMTYRGWMWTHGYEYRPIESAISKMFSQPDTYPQLFKEYDVDYVVIGPNEKNVWKANTNYFAQHFTLLKETANYRVYSVNVDTI